MEDLPQLLDKLLETLHALGTVLAQEHALLCADTLAGVALQPVTDIKSQLLVTINELEKQRLAAEQLHGLQAPYAHHPHLAACWENVQQLGQQLREQNQHNGLLLKQHIEHNAQALAVLSQQHSPLYGPDGQARSGNLPGSVRHIAK
ncbi:MULTISPECIES: flagella synthesis protein FlgN [unclassified Serratia (in: enterobacteria)]|uniref:flagella synthesis protein FlgN n=1 Tax=unclassified Serratia (in: enterobacteria) TaxID=2647522 RepID=UPI00050755BB|nr:MULTISPECIES: flagellar export chaperone FlgN [unclassified Serratia (in: enterobacteria)]KFK93487.1 flagellar biosynthesis protein FlgN [Serratia sp. Ag1]KFK93548.1 flagellar biosynthesis protein FlgN [Serratia sp. Ag2]